MHSENELGYQTRSDGFGILYGEIAGALIGAMRQKWNGDRAQSGSRLWKEKGKEASGAVYGKWSEDGSP